MTEPEETTGPTVRQVLSAAAQLDEWEISVPDKIAILQATPNEYMVRVYDRDGNVQGLPVTVSEGGAA